MINAEGISKILGGKPKAGGGFMACCPAHDDRTPSLSIKDGDNGRPLVNCLAGCSQDAVLAALKEKGAWYNNTTHTLSPTEHQALKEAAERIKTERMAKDKAKHAEAAKKAKVIYEAAKEDPAQHPYAIKKGLPLGDLVIRGPWSQRGWADALIIPLYASDKSLTSLQAINVDGAKDFLAGSKKSGCFHPIGKITGATGLVVIGEGLATVAAVCEVMGCPGVMAVDAGNLETVSKEIKKLAPKSEIIIIADDDRKEDGTNPGKAAAIKAATAIGCKMTIPDLGKKADAWDVRHEQGADGIKAMIAAASVAEIARIAVASGKWQGNIIEYDPDSASDDIQHLRGALAVIPANAKQGKHEAGKVVGWGLRHASSKIETHIGAVLSNEWDNFTGGRSFEIFSTCEPNYNHTQPVTTASIYALAKQHGWTGQIPWGNPEPLITHQQAAPYPLEALPGTIGNAVREVVGFVQCPVALGACSAMAVVSTVVQGLVDVRRAVKLEGPTSLFLLAIADSGERKTSVDGHFSGPVKQWDAEQAEAVKPELQQFEAENAVWEAKKNGLVAAVTAASKNGNPTGDLEAQVIELEEEKPEEPKVPRLMFSDSTPEALAYSLAHKWPVGGVLSSEAGIVLGGHAMGKDSAMRNMAMLNSFWDADPYTIDRRTAPSYTVRGVRLTMSLAVQSETVKNFLDSSKGLARGIGFLARFLVAWPESTQGGRMFKDPTEHWPQLAKFHRRLGALLDYPLTFDDKEDLSPVMLELSSEAKEIWVAFHNDVEAELRPGREMAEAKDVASKAADNAVRLAALFHMFENGIEGAIGPFRGRDFA